MRSQLFVLGDFTLHSGARSSWKIECDALTDADWRAIAAVAREIVGPYKVVVACGGASEKFGAALGRFAHPNASDVLIADDVLTTGATMEDAREGIPRRERVKGVVLFARGPCPDWVVPLFRFSGVP